MSKEVFGDSDPLEGRRGPRASGEQNFFDERAAGRRADWLDNDISRMGKNFDPWLPKTGKSKPSEIFPKLAPLFTEMDTIEASVKQEVFSAGIDSQRLLVYKPFFDKAKAAFAYRAVIENWNYDTAKGRYENFMRKLCEKCKTNGSTTALKEMFQGIFLDDWSYFSAPIPLTLQTRNVSLDNRTIRSEKRHQVLARLLLLEALYLNRALFCAQWNAAANRCDAPRELSSEQQGRLSLYMDYGSKKGDGLLDFYRTFLLDAAIMENKTESELQREYADLLAKIVWEIA